MTKDILKEIIIILLLCLAIILILGVLLYKYVPISKTIPNEVAYITPEEVEKQLLDTKSLDEGEIVMTYEINSDDLRNYTKIHDYNPGKANPFSSYETSSSTTNGSNSKATTSSETTSTGNSNTDSQSSTNSQETTTSGGQYFQDKGTK